MNDLINNIEKEVENITKWIKEYVEKSHSKGVVIGNTISGEDIILSPGTYVLYKSEPCIVC